MKSVLWAILLSFVGMITAKGDRGLDSPEDPGTASVSVAFDADLDMSESESWGSSETDSLPEQQPLPSGNAPIEDDIFKSMAMGDFNKTDTLLGNLSSRDLPFADAILKKVETLAKTKYLPHVVRMLHKMASDRNMAFGDSSEDNSTPPRSRDFISTIVATGIEQCRKNMEASSDFAQFPDISKKAFQDLDENGGGDELTHLVNYGNPHAMLVIVWHYMSKVDQPGNEVFEVMGEIGRWIRTNDIASESKQRLGTYVYYLIGRAYHKGCDGFLQDNDLAHFFHEKGMELAGENAFFKHWRELARHQYYGWGCEKNEVLAQETYEIYKNKCTALGITPKPLLTITEKLRKFFLNIFKG